MCKGFPQAVSYQVINGANDCWRYARLPKLPSTTVTDSTTAVFYDGGEEETQAASTVRPEKEGKNFFARAPPAILLWGLLTLVFLGGSIYAGRWLLPRVRHGSMLIRNFF